MKIVLASHNKKKINELRVLLSEYKERLGEITVLSMEDVGIYDDVEETGTTFEENALIKAKAGAESGYISIADDSGLSVDALGGAPGVYSARFAGEPCDDDKNNALLLEKLQNVPDEKRTGRYISSIACVFPDGRILVTEDSCEGVILREPHGNGGFGYDPYFYFEEYGKTFAELTLEEKNRVSHRAKAFRKFAESFVKTWETYYAEQ